MRAIILAAGRGSRLRPLTDDRPKGLVPVCGKPLLSYTLAGLAEVGAAEVIVVGGYRADQLCRDLTGFTTRPPLRFVVNQDYRNSNSVVSLYLTRPWSTEPFVLIEGDVLITAEVLAEMFRATGELVAVDRTKAHTDVDVKLEISNGRVTGFGDDVPVHRCSGEFVGVSRWSVPGAAALHAAATALVTSGGRDLLYDAAIREVAQQREIGLLAVDDDEWAELDSVEDLPRVERFAKRLLTRSPRADQGQTYAS